VLSAIWKKYIVNSCFQSSLDPINYLIDTRVGEVTEDVALVETSHGELGDDHLQERRERRENTELLLVESESSRGREVTTLHDTRGDEHLRVLLVDGLEAGRALEIRVDDHDLLGRLLLRETVEHQVDRVAEHDTVADHLLGRADVLVVGLARLD
jgi:hypothetical protein